MDTGRYLKVPDQPDAEAMDKYTASIELSNACRQFYKSRLEAAHCIKSRWEKSAALAPTCCGDSESDSKKTSDRIADDNASSYARVRTTATTTSTKRQRNSIDEAMEKLRTEMTSLMDQDLSLMKQLLTLNETIEELKWQRRYYYSRRSLPGSSTDIHHSDCSISDTEMYDSEDDSLLARSSPASTKTTTITTATTTSTCQTPLVVLAAPSSASSSSCTPHRKYGVMYSSSSGHVTAGHAQRSDVDKRCGDCEVVTIGGESASVKVFHSEQDSFDSGFHEPSSEEEAVV